MQVVKKQIIFLLFLFSILFFNPNVHGVTPQTKITVLMGEVKVRTVKDTSWTFVDQETLINEKDVILTKERSAAVITLVIGEEPIAMVAVEEKSKLIFSHISINPQKNICKIFIKLLEGQITVILSKPLEKESIFEVKTRTSRIDIQEGSSTIKARGGN